MHWLHGERQRHWHLRDRQWPWRSSETFRRPWHPSAACGSGPVALSKLAKEAREQGSKERTARPCPAPPKQMEDRYGFVIVAHEHRKRQEAGREQKGPPWRSCSKHAGSPTSRTLMAPSAVPGLRFSSRLPSLSPPLSGWPSACLMHLSSCPTRPLSCPMCSSMLFYAIRARFKVLVA